MKRQLLGQDGLVHPVVVTQMRGHLEIVVQPMVRSNLIIFKKRRLFSHIPCHAVNAPSPYLPSTPGQPMTPSSASYLPGTPGGQPMTPGTGLDVMSPVIGNLLLLKG